MRKELRFSVAVLLAMISGCMDVSPNRESDVRALLHFNIEKGKTTKTELIAHFGQPPTDTMGSDGTEMMTWSFTHIHVDSGSIVLSTITSGMAGTGHADSQGCILQVTLQNGVVTDFTRTMTSNKV